MYLRVCDVMTRYKMCSCFTDEDTGGLNQDSDLLNNSKS